MKTARLFVLALIAAAGSLSAQTIEFVTVEWQRSVDQKNASGVVNAGSTPYTFRANVSGTQGSPVTASTFSSVTLGLTNNTVGPTLTFQSGDDGEWQFQSSYADQAAALTAYPTSGDFTYAMNLNGVSATTTNASGNTNVPFPTIPNLSTSILQAPLVTLTNGTWQGNGTFLVTSVSSAVTLTFNNLYASTPNASDSFHYDVWLNNGAALSGGSTEGFINWNAKTNSSAAATIPSLTIAAGQLVDGNTYTLEVGYEQLLASSAILSNSAFAVALTGIRSKISIVTPLAAVPEPAAYALWAGLAAFGLVARRRRQIASPSAPRPARAA